MKNGFHFFQIKEMNQLIIVESSQYSLRSEPEDLAFSS